jgi:phenylacetaldehyde dehydrogenase
MNAPVTIDQATAAAADFVSRPLQLYIDGEWAPAASGETFDVYDPATGKVFASAASAGAVDIDRAVRAARRAFDGGPWPAMAPGQRTKLMWKLADAIEANADELARLETLDNGKPMTMSRMVDIPGSAEMLRYFSGWATKIAGETPVTVGTKFAYTLREPIGVVGQIVPWNFPLLMAVGKIAPALAAGCTIVLKPAEQTPLTTVRLAQLIAQVGFPPGVINIVTGFGQTAGQALVDHPLVDKISFTGSTAVGKTIIKSAADTMKRVTLELGGKSPTIIYGDADLEKAIPAAASGIFFNAGQVCAAGSRLFVHRSVYDKVLEGLAERAKGMRLGAGVDPQTQMGPLVSKKQQERVMGYIDGVSAGVEVLHGALAPEGDGYFVRPTILSNTTSDMAAVTDEIFGPVLCAMPFGDESLDEMAAKANDTLYGLNANIWTRDISTAHGLARKIKSGTVGINGGGGIDFGLPFGGYKQSGLGRENGRPGVEVYTEIKTVGVGF